MDKYELVGFLLQHLRDNHEADEEDISTALLRETSKIYRLLIRHGYVCRDMFDASGIGEEADSDLPNQYACYETTNYPGNFVCFAQDFGEWLVSDKKPKTLGVIDVINMAKEWSLVDIKIKPQAGGAKVVVKAPKHSEFVINETVVVDC